jgi:hypothetical protein
MPSAVKDLRREAAGWFGKTEPEVDAFLRYLREAGLIPAGERRGRGVSAAIETEHALALLLALLSGEIATKAPTLVLEMARFPYHGMPLAIPAPGGHAQFDPHFAPGPDGGASHGTPLALILRDFIDQLRAGNAPTKLRASELWSGEEFGLRVFKVKMLAFAPGSENPAAILEHTFGHVPHGWTAPDWRAQASAPLSGAHWIGGNVLHEIAALLGPLANASGGGGSRVVPFKLPPEMPEPHKLAALEHSHFEGRA